MSPPYAESCLAASRHGDEAAEQGSLRLTPDTPPTTPADFRRPDGTTRFRPANSTIYTSQALWDAEERLLALSRRTDAPTISLDTIEQATAQPNEDGVILGDDQAEALTAIAISGRVIDLLVGPAGAGKTTALNALRQAWEAENGEGSVVGLAPSPTAAQVLGQDLGISTENTAKWLYDHEHAHAAFAKDQLVIIDEASLAGTFALDKITAHAADVGAKVLLVGDWAQLQAVEAGGAFAMLAADRDDTPELLDIHRFAHAWEKAASLALRHSHPEAIETYAAHGRVHSGDTEAMHDAAYQAWRDDIAAGRSSILIADDRTTVAALNTRAREDRIQAGQVDPTRSVPLAEGTRASVGDVIITRLNDRRIIAGRSGWVRNGDRWTITHISDDGSVTLRRQDRKRGASVVLPAGYVADHVDLGYALTAYRAQGITVDTAHVMASPTTTRENLYVAMTRGRDANHVYAVTDITASSVDPVETTDALRDDPTDAQTILARCLQTSGAEPSAHETHHQEHERWESLAQLAAEYRTIAQAARPSAVDVIASQRRGMSAIRQPPRLIVGLIPMAQEPIPPEYREALADIQRRIETRAGERLREAIINKEPWVANLDPRPTDPAGTEMWMRTAIVVAAYRDMHGIRGDGLLGPAPPNPNQSLDYLRTRQALEPHRRTPEPTPSASSRSAQSDFRIAQPAL